RDTMRFAAIGLDHRHIYDLTQGLLDAGLDCAGYCPETTNQHVLAGFRKRFPAVPAVPRARLLDDPAITVVAIATMPSERGPIAIAAMRRGKDVLVDKPGVSSLDQLAEMERAVAETGRIWSVCLSARLLTPCVAKALEIVRAGGIGRVVQTLGLGPHRLNRATRPAWFWDPASYGGILNDIASHQIDQFLTFADADDAEIVSATVGEYGTAPGFEDFGEIILRTDDVRGYIRVDWFTPDGLPTWGDGRLIVTGTEGMIELRKNVDIAGRDGADHLFLIDRNSTRHIDCAGNPLTYFRDLAHDLAHRTETAMTQRHVFAVTRLALQAQARATRFTPGAHA
ncbi:MAG: Gfo/Idh/MocA family oxidoreductase, partial [Acetobacteraceae bacterium]